MERGKPAVAALAPLLALVNLEPDVAPIPTTPPASAASPERGAAARRRRLAAAAAATGHVADVPGGRGVGKARELGAPGGAGTPGGGGWTAGVFTDGAAEVGGRRRLLEVHGLASPAESAEGGDRPALQVDPERVWSWLGDWEEKVLAIHGAEIEGLLQEWEPRFQQFGYSLLQPTQVSPARFDEAFSQAGSGYNADLAAGGGSG